MISLLPDYWNFDNVLDENHDAIMPVGPVGSIHSREDWEIIKRGGDLFLSLGTKEEIDQHNLELAENRRSSKSTSSDIPPPKSTTTTEGYIYVLRSEAGHYKIGKAIDPFSRSKTIGTQHAYKIDLIYIALCLDYTRVERYLHQALSSYRMNGEWFDLPADKVEWLLYHDWIDDARLGGIVTSMERIPQ